ncbi:TRAP transporter substrate-binding protein [Pelagibius litoralis]|uniref:TRAP transporter substrate-binding protein n=1 Tax=Pelagibius litoralis TaxID=374515 RepID=A0A967EZ80_9PROT|nr:TRAP transporter substrate-binding protein [Pelagibius litoralis]NIA70089.1 TRAP transporter substrate-binding protein [Pelagibius litoralis]
MLHINRLLRCLALPLALLAGTMVTGPATAQEVTLRIHHFLPPPSTTHKDFIAPWAAKVEAESQGRISIEIYPAMQLGGKPPQLFDQARDGVVDIVWTLPGYTAGRFPTMEVFELPFMAASAEATSQAAHAFYEKHAREEFKDIHPLMFHVHAPGSFHMRGKEVRNLEDLKGLKVRAPTRMTNIALKNLGATPVGMPVPAVPEALSKGVVEGALLPFEVTRPLKVHELTQSHTEIGGDRGLYTAVFLFAMNKARYESLPDDLRQVIDNNSGIPLAKQIGQVWDEAEAPGREAAAQLGDSFHTIEGEELARWQAATAPVVDAWMAEMKKSGKDGQALLDEARALVAGYSAQ